MRNLVILSLVLMAILTITSCESSNTAKQEETSEDTLAVDTTAKDFNYVVDQFGDVKIMRYQIPGFDELSLQQKKLVYYLSQAALFGRDITFDQNYKHNLCIRRTLEEIYKNFTGDKTTEDYKNFEVFLKRVWFSNGIHHHYSTEKFVPDFSKDYLKSLMDNCPDANWPLEDGETAEQLYSKVSEILYTPEIAAKRVCQAAGKDHIVNSANNFYEGVTQAEVEAFYDAIRDKDDETPVSYGINSKVVKENGKVVEKVWKAGGMYGEAIEQIIFWLEKAKNVAEDDFQKESIVKLIEYYKTGNLNTWDDYNIAWVKDLSAQVDFVNGFIENYGDPMGMKATWESVVNFKDLEATKRAKIISENAQWFEDHSPVDEKFKKKEVKGVTAKVITVAQLGGDCYPSTPIGINLPNADWIRKEHGSKSVTMENITYAYDQASMGSGYMEEFAFSQEIIDRAKKYGALAGNLHTDLHECLGHGSGQLLPGVNPEALRSYGSALEETRADLFALYYLLDDRMVELGLMPSLEVAKAEYDNYISNGIMWQLKRVKPGADIEQAHMRNRQLIAKWTYENGLADSVISKIQKEGKTYFVINDYNKLRELFGKLLAEVQRIKSEGDYEAGKDLVEKYAVKVDQDLHAEMLDRYAKLNLAPYGGFMNPVLKPIEENGEIKNVVVEYPDDYTEQMLWYSEDYSPLPTYN